MMFALARVPRRASLTQMSTPTICFPRFARSKTLKFTTLTIALLLYVTQLRSSAAGFVDCIEGLGGYVLATGDVEVEIIAGNAGALYTSDLYLNLPGADIFCGSSRSIGQKTTVTGLPAFTELPFY